MNVPHKKRIILPVLTSFTVSLLILIGLFSNQSVMAQSGNVSGENRFLPNTMENILIGLEASMSGGLAQSGEAIKRGMLIAIHEINEAGGVLGRKFELVERDNRGIPARGIDNIEELAELKNLVAVVGGLHTPVALAQLKAIHHHKLIYLGPWAAGTPIVDNGFQPNFVFRVSARDEFAGGFLIEKALQRGFKKPGLLLWRTGWGRSNQKAMTAAMQRLNVEGSGVHWFNTGQQDISGEIEALIAAGADVVVLVANAPEGLTVIQNMAARPSEKRIPIISHWGITGANIVQKDPRAFEAVDLVFLQTYSFLAPTSPEKAERVLNSYCVFFEVCGNAIGVISPVGTAHAYDLVHILRLAIKAAGTIDRENVRAALEGIRRYEGLVRTYNPPFTPARHDALNMTDFQLSKYDLQGNIVPVKTQFIQ